jgi:hypothetical protein
VGEHHANRKLEGARDLLEPRAPRQCDVVVLKARDFRLADTFTNALGKLFLGKPQPMALLTYDLT